MKKNFRRILPSKSGLLVTLMAVLPSILVPSVRAATGTWTETAAGTYYWQEVNFGDANTPLVPVWGVTGTGTDGDPFVLNAIPNGADDIANLLGDFTGNQVVILNGAITLGTLNLGDVDGSNTLSIQGGIGGSLNFDVTSGNATVAKAVGSISMDTIAAGISVASGDSLTLAVQDGTLALTGVISGSTGGIRKTGTGTLLVSGANTYTGGTILGDGTSAAGSLFLGASTTGGLSGSAITSGPLGLGTLTLAAASTPTLRSDTTTTRTLANNIVANSNFTLGAAGSGSLILGGNIDLGGGAPRTITAVGEHFLTGLISNGALSTAGGTLHIRGLNTGLTSTVALGSGTTTVIGAANQIGATAALTANPFGTATLTMGGNTLAADIARSFSNNITLNGDLTLGADPRTAGNYDGQVTLGGTVNLGGSARTITTTTSGVPTFVSGTADTISGAISNGSIVKTGNGRLILSSGSNSFTSLTINAGVVQVAADANLGTAPASYTAGAITLAGGTLALNPTGGVTGTGNRGVTVNSASVIDLMAAQTWSIGNGLTGANTALSGSGDLTVLLRATGSVFAIIGSQTAGGYSGNLSLLGAGVATGGVFQAGTTGGGGNGTVLGAVSSITAGSGTGFRISNGNVAGSVSTNRINDAAGITMNGAYLDFDNPATASLSYAETIGTTTLNRGANGINGDQSATSTTAALTIANLVRSTGATVNFSSNTAYAIGTAGLGQTTRNSIILTQVNGVTPAAGFMGAWATANTAVTTSGSYSSAVTAAEWAKYSATLGVQPFDATDYNGGGSFSEASMTASTYHAKLAVATTTTTTLGGSRTVGTLNLSSTNAAGNNIIAFGSNTLTIDSGGILVAGTAPTTAHAFTGTGALLVGSGNELIINTVGTNALSIANPISTTAVSLVKSGTGALTLTGTNSFTGGVYINQGSLRLAPGPNGNSLSLPTANSISVVSGSLASSGTGALIIPNNITVYDSLTFGDAVGAARTLVTGNITLSAPSGGIATLGAHTGTIAQILGNISGGSLRIANTTATGRLALQGTNTFSASDRIQVDTGFLTVGSSGALGSAKIVMNGGGLETGFGFRGSISNDVLITANSTLGSNVHGHPLTLSGSIDLGGAIRTITNDGPGLPTTFSGVITNGGWTKAGDGVAIFTNANNNYLGGTIITNGFIYLKGSGVAGANVPGNNIVINGSATGDPGIILDGPSNLGSNQALTFFLPASMTTGTQSLGLGAGFSASTNANPLYGFQNGTTGTGVGIMNIRLTDVAAAKFLVSLNGSTLNQDIIGGTGNFTNLNTAAPNTRVWIGAGMAGGTIAVPISAGFGGNYRLGGGFDASAASNNQAGTLQVNANVLSGSGILYIGAEDATGLANIGNNSVVWMRGAQSSFSGAVTIGVGGLLNVADGSYLGSGTTINFVGGTMRVLNESGLAGYDATHINTAFSTKNLVVGVGGGSIRHDSGTGNFSNQIVQFGSLTIDASNATAANRTFNVIDAGVNSGGMNFTSLTFTNNGTNQGILSAQANFTRITGNITSGTAGWEKAGNGTLIVDGTYSGAPLTISGTGALVITNPSGFAPSSTTVNAGATIAFRSNAGTYSTNLGALNMPAGSPTLVFGNLDGTGPTSSTVTFNSALNPTVANRTLTVRAFDNTTVNGTGAVTLAGGLSLTYSVEAGYYKQSGLITGISTSPIVKSGRGVLELAGANTGFAGGVNVTSGTLLISDASGAGTGGITYTGGSGSVLLTSGITVTNPLALGTGASNSALFGGLSGNSTYSGNFNIASVTGLSATPLLANFDPSGTTTFSGVISQGNTFTAQGILTKVGNGTVRLTNANTFSSGLLVQRGTLTGVAQSTGSPFGTNSAITVGGGTLKLEGISSGTTTTTSAALTVGGNNFGGKLVIDATAGGSTALTVGSLGTRSGRGTLVFIPQTGTGETLNVTAAPSGVNVANGIVAPWFLKQASGTTTTGNFIASGSSAMLDKTYTAGVDQGDLNTLNGATLVLNNDVSTTLTDNRSIYSLRTDSDINLDTFTLTIGQQDVPTVAVNQVSGLILNNGANISGTGSGELRLGSSELNVFVGGGSTSTISARINSLEAVNASTTFTNAGLTKTGNGTLILSGSNRYVGITTVASGTLQAGAANVLGQYTMNQRNIGTTLQIAAGATFDTSTTGYNQTIGSLAGQGTINIGANMLIVGNDNTSPVFSGQLISASGSTLLKTGTGVLELSNILTGTLANSVPSNIYVDQGTLRIHASDGAPLTLPNGDTFALQTQSAIANGATFNLRGGTLDIRYNHGDVSSNAHTLRTNYNIVNVLSSTLNTDVGLLGSANYTNKQVSINNVTLNRFTLTISNANTDVLQIDGTVTMTDIANLSLSNDASLSSTSNVTDGGNFYTLNKQGGGNLGVNANTTFTGGTVISLGRIYFGQRGQWTSGYEDSPSAATLTYNSTAKLGTGAIWVNSFNNANAINSIRLAETNLNSGQLLYVRSAGLGAHQSQVEVLHDAPLSSYNLRSTTQGALALLISPTTTSTNVGRWTNTLDLQRLGNGAWGFAAVNDAVYDNNTLGVGMGEVYRFYGTSGIAAGGALVFNKANTLTGSNRVDVGLSAAQFSSSNSINANAIVLFDADQNYTGSTTIFRGAAQNANYRSAPQNALRVYGDLTTSGIENYGRLEMIGAGRFTNDAGTNVVPLSLRIGSYLSLDYISGFTTQVNAAGNYLADVSMTSGINPGEITNKWQDDLTLVLPGSTLNVASYNTRDTHEVIGGLSITGLSDIILSPNSNGAVILELGSAITFNSSSDTLRISGTVLGTAQPTAASTTGQTRMLFTNAAHAPSTIGTLTSGATMISPRYFNGTNSTFMGYTAGLGFLPVLPNVTSTTAAWAASTSTDFVDLTTNAVTSVPTTQNVFALRAGVGISQASTGAYTINIGSGGLILNNGANAIYTGFQSTTQASATTGTFAFPGDAYLWAVGGFQQWIRNNITTGGVLSINGVQSAQVVLSGNNTINGDIVLNGGTLNIYNVNNDGATTPNYWNSGTVNPTGGTGTNIVLLGANGNNATNILPRLELRNNGAGAVTSRNIVIGTASQSVPYVEINVDRANGSTTNVAQTVGALTVNGAGSEGTIIQFTQANDYDLTFTGNVALNTVTTQFNVNSATNNTNDVQLSGVVSGISKLVKTGGGNLWLNNVANSYSGGTYLNGGTLRINGTGSSTATFLGTGPIEVNGGTLLINGGNTANLTYASSANNSLIFRGNATVAVQGNTHLMNLGAATSVFQTAGSPVIQFSSPANSASFRWNGAVSIYDNPNLFVNNDQSNTVRGGLTFGSAAAGNTFQGSGNIQKTGFGNLTYNLNTGANTFSGNINVFQGGLRAETVNDKYTTGNITLMPGSWIVARANGNTTYNPNQITYFASNSTAHAGIVLRGTTDAYSLHLNASSIFTGNADGSSVTTAGTGTNGGQLSIEGTYGAAALDMSTVFGGYWYLSGSQVNGTYSLSTLGAGAANTTLYGAGNTGVYRLGGADGTLTISTGVLVGANAAVQIGAPWVTSGRGTVTLTGTNTYGGITVVGIGRDRGTGSPTLAALSLDAGGGTTLSTNPLGSSTIHVFGRMNFGGATGAANSSTTANDNSYIFYPGSRLRFDFNASNTITQAQGGKWGDNVAIALNGTNLEVNGESGLNSTDNHEIVGSISFDRMSEIRILGNGTNGTAALTTPSLTRIATNYGVLRFTHSASVLGSLTSTTNDAENFFITNFTTANTAGNGNWSSPTGTGHYSLTNDPVMLNPYFVSSSDNQWMRYNATNGMQTLHTSGTTFGSTYLRLSTAGTVGTGSTAVTAGISSIAGTTITYGGASSGMLNNGTEILDISAVVGTMSSNLDILALRMGGSGAGLNQDATNAFSTLQIRSGGMILNTTNNENTIRTNFIFGTAASPGTAYVYSAQNTTNLDGQITATDFVKFGTGGVRIVQDQRTFTGKWVVNQGSLEFTTPYATGTNGTNQILLNGASTSNSDTLSVPSVLFTNVNNSQNLSGDLGLSTFYHGLITVVDAGQVRFFIPNDHQSLIQNVKLTTSSPTKGLQPGYFLTQVENSRTIGNISSVTLDDDFVFRVESATYANTSTTGMGSTAGIRFLSLNNQGLYNITKIGDGMMYLGDITASFTGSRIFTINEGAVRVEHATGSLGAAGTKFIVDNGGALDLAVTNFNPDGTLIQNAGSIERWSVNRPRAASTVTLPQGVHLQINQSQMGTQTINLTGGALMGYLAADMDEIAVIRTLGSGITVNLQANSYLGQIYPFSGTLAYDMGKQNGYIADPFNPRLNGALLDIKGQITGAFNLTKVGTDVIQLSNDTNDYNNTFITSGTLLMGIKDALPKTKTVTMSANGVLDLNGFSTTVGSIAGTTGTITSGATTATSLNVGGDNSNFSYTGVVSQGVRIVKQGSGEFTMGSASLTATITAGSTTVTGIGGTGTTGWYVGMPVSGPGIPSGTTIAAILSANSVVLSNPATANGTSIAAANLHWGGTEIVSGKVKIQDDSNLGVVPTSESTGADNITFSGGTLHIAQTFALSAMRGLQVNVDGGFIEVDSGKTLTIGGKVALGGNLTTTSTGGKIFSGPVSGNGNLIANGGAGEVVTLQAVNTMKGKVEINNGSTVNLSGSGSLPDATWIEVKSGGAFGANGTSVDAVVSGQGTINGNLTITSNTGSVAATGVLRPGAASANSVANGGDMVGSLTVNGNLTLAGNSTSVTRLVMQVNSPTLNDGANILNAVNSGTLLSYLNSQESTWNSAANGDHDYLNVTGTLNLNKNGAIQVTGWTPAYGDILDLLDWTGINLNDWNNGAALTSNQRAGGLLGDLELPTLAAWLSYDMTLFNTSGIIVITPEPSRVLLLLLAMMPFFFRRRRR